MRFWVIGKPDYGDDVTFLRFPLVRKTICRVAGCARSPDCLQTREERSLRLRFLATGTDANKVQAMTHDTITGTPGNLLGKGVHSGDVKVNNAAAP